MLKECGLKSRNLVYSNIKNVDLRMKIVNYDTPTVIATDASDLMRKCQEFYANK